MNDGKIVIYEKTTCSKCRAAIALLDKSGRPFTRVAYYETPLTTGKLKELVGKLGMRAAELVRTNEPAYTKMDIDAFEMPEEEVIKLLVENPDLLQRPILEYGERAVLGRPVENIYAFLDTIPR